MSAVFENVSPERIICRIGDKKILKDDPVIIIFEFKGERKQIIAAIENVELAYDEIHPQLIIKLKTKQTKTA